MSNHPPIVLELEIWSQPGKDLVQHAGKDISVACANELGLPQGIVLGLSDVPDKVDSTNLHKAFRERELKEADFEAFCTTRGLTKDAESSKNAMRFLAYEYGRPLTWVHLPASQEGMKIGSSLFSWVRKQGYCLVMPLELYCISSESMLHDLLEDYS
jgi:hypothetical protein